MSKFKNCKFFFFVFILLSSPLLFANALHRFIQKEDGLYSYKIVSRSDFATYSVLSVDITALNWRAPGEVSPNVWHPRLTLIVPPKINYPTALMNINGGKTSDAFPREDDLSSLVKLATSTKTVVADLSLIPMQGLTFSDETTPRYEDQIIAYSWNQFLSGGDEEWPLQLPMVKSSVKGLDTIQKVIKSEFKTDIQNFVVMGASKRGWTTWLLAAVDSRVKAIIPIVIDLLNIRPSLKNHYKNYGFWAPAIKDYVDMKIMDRMDTPRMDELLSVVDPYSYLPSYANIPKMLINASSDQFFYPDSANFYYQDLPGVKYLRYVPNSGHRIDFNLIANNITRFYWNQLKPKAFVLPQISYRYIDANTLEVTCPKGFTVATLWTNTNPNSRDFRLETVGTSWIKTDLRVNAATLKATVNMKTPAKGALAYFVEVKSINEVLGEFSLTTPIKVLPVIL